MSILNDELAGKVSRLVVKQLAKEDFRMELKRPIYVPIGVSARHIHMERGHMERLFGPGYKLTVYKRISQPGQFAANEKLTIAGVKGKIENVRVLGPLRNKTQVEISLSDSRKLGLVPPVRKSGDLNDTPGVILIGPAGKVSLNEGCIIAERHIHMTEEEALFYGVTDGQKVMVRIGGIKGGIMDNVYVRVRSDYAFDMHIDTDDANAFMLENGDLVEIIK